jgi:hypothetical protein
MLYVSSKHIGRKQKVLTLARTSKIIERSGKANFIIVYGRVLGYVYNIFIFLEFLLFSKAKEGFIHFLQLISLIFNMTCLFCCCYTFCL